ncbi:MAG: aminotransferase class V-fold PLP-dependent enzyme [Bacteroidetes bacterium]|nr:aminotransferase class V-fold PLP-dependent enzyme [Bacteroidota bacterium]
MDKRSFLKQMGGLGMAAWAWPANGFTNTRLDHTFPSPIEDEETLWETVRSHYDLKPDYINLESGYYNIIPLPTLQKFVGHIKQVNIEGSYYMRNQLNNDRLILRKRMAAWMDCDHEELVITRNTTESLDLIIAGYPWQKGDEAIYADQDYGAMKVMFEQVAARHGVVNKVVSVPNHPKSDDEIVALYESQITSKTKLIMVCHMINITGQILPIKKICAMAHKHGVEVMVDGAHCVGHFEYSLNELDCDYYGSSLHKWLATPLGAGLLYINKNWPLLADYIKDTSDIKRLNHIGTHPVHTNLAIHDALDYLEWMGPLRKEKRLRFLQNYWTSALKTTPNVLINTPADPARSCGIANVGIQGLKPALLAQKLLEDHQVFTVAIDYANVQGCRISPNVFTTTEDLDHFIKAIKTLAQEIG